MQVKDIKVCVFLDKSSLHEDCNYYYIIRSFNFDEKFIEIIAVGLDLYASKRYQSVFSRQFEFS